MEYNSETIQVDSGCKNKLVKTHNSAVVKWSQDLCPAVRILNETNSVPGNNPFMLRDGNV